MIYPDIFVIVSCGALCSIRRHSLLLRYTYVCLYNLYVYLIHIYIYAFILCGIILTTKEIGNVQ